MKNQNKTYDKLIKKVVKLPLLSLEKYYEATKPIFRRLKEFTNEHECQRLITLSHCKRDETQKSIKVWYDEFDNLLLFTPEPVIIKNSLSPKTKKFLTNDLFHQVPLRKIYQVSKRCFISWGYDPEFIGLVSFYCMDFSVRTYLFDGSWRRISNLYLGNILLDLEDFKHDFLGVQANILPVEKETSCFIQINKIHMYSDFLPPEIKDLLDLWKKENV